MVISYTGKNIEITDEMKDYFEKRCKKFKFYYDHIINIAVVMEKQRGQFNIEIKVSANDDKYFAKNSNSNWRECIDIVTDKIEKEIKKKRDKLTDHYKE